MPSVKLYDMKANIVGDLKLADALFGAEYCQGKTITKFPIYR